MNEQKAILEVCTAHIEGNRLNGARIECNQKMLGASYRYLKEQTPSTEQELIDTVAESFIREPEARFLLENMTSQSGISILIPVKINTSLFLQTYKKKLEEVLVQKIKETVDGLDYNLIDNIFSEVLDTLPKRKKN